MEQQNGQNGQNGQQNSSQQGLQQSAQNSFASAAQQQNQQEQVVAVRKNGDGDIVEFKLTSGTVVDYKTAQQMAKQGQIAHVNVFKGRDGDEHLRSDADGDPSNNLDNLPTF